MTRVLVVDDSALMRAVIRRDLLAEGYEVREAAGGEAALAACAEAVPDVVVMDVEMPGWDGLETLRRMKGQDALHDVPVLFLTGRTDAADVAEALRLGAHDYLRKPFDGIELIARVRAAARFGTLQEALRDRNVELERVAGVDALTGVANRRAVEEEARRASSRLRRHGGWLAVVLVDVDHFKAVNDTHGHHAGDAVLVAMAERLGTGTRAEDVLARWGGEEFLVLVTDTDADGVADLAERVRAVVASAPFAADGRDLPLTVSVGWAACSGEPSFDALVRAADRELYAAKAAGRDVVQGTVLPSA